MAIASHSTPSFSPSFCSTRTQFTGLSRFPSVTLSHSRSNQIRSSTRRLVVSSRLNSSEFSGADGFVSPDKEGFPYELQHDFSPQRQRKGSPVYVTLPLDAVGPEGRVLRVKAMMVSFRSLALAGVEGVVLEIWWGLVERNEPMVYDWRGYRQLIKMAGTWGLKVRVVLAFHQCGRDSTDPNWIPLPLWVLDEIKKDPDLLYSDTFGTRSTEYISLGCDTLPVLCGRSPIQAYADFMRNFRNTFRPCFGIIITGVQIGMGPDGELRYPSCPSQMIHGRRTEFQEFQCYDKYMIASLNACASDIGMPEWGQGAPPQSTGIFNLNLFSTVDYSPWTWGQVYDCITKNACASDIGMPAWGQGAPPQSTGIFKLNLFPTVDYSPWTWGQYMIASLKACASDIGMPEWGQSAPPQSTGIFKLNLFSTVDYSPWTWGQGRFFLKWYSGMLLLHGERICREAEAIFRGTEVDISAKVAAFHRHYQTYSQPSELTAGYYNTFDRNGYLPIARMFSRYGFGLCCSCFEMKDAVENKINPVSSPEGLLRQLLFAARRYDIPLEGQSISSDFNDISFKQVLKMSKFYIDGAEKRPFSFNFVRMGKNMFQSPFWDRFTRFVRHMSDGHNNFRARLNSVADVRPKSLTRAA